jgi:ubiquinone/menaquinone biosynthesis C-methylase UbiE
MGVGEIVKEKRAIAVSDAIAKNDHDLFIYESALSQEKVKWIDDYLKDFLELGKTILELGCGSGKQLFKIEEYGLQTIGLEISKEMIKRIERNKNEVKSRIKIIEGSYYTIPLEDASVDYVLFPLSIVENSYEEYEIICREARRILKSNGRYFMTMKENIAKHNKYTNEYDILAGSFDTKINTPAKEKMEYPTYYWTIAFEHYIAQKYLRFEKMIEMGEGTFLLVYSKA